jgi:hypothetical protein
LLEAIDAPLDEIAPLVGFAIVIDRPLAVRSRWDDGFNAAVSQIVANFVAVVALVAEEPAGSTS